MPELQETQLVRQAVAGDSTSFSRLVENYQRAIFALLLGKLSDYEAAQDLAQDTFVQAYLGLRRLSSPERFASWLYGIARNLANNHIRRRRDFVSLDETLRRAESDPCLAVPPPDPERAEMRQRVLETIGRLPEKSREAVLLFYVDDRSYREIAAMLGVSLGVVRSRLEYGRKKLKKELLTMVEDTLREAGPGPEFSGKVLEHVSGIKPISPYLSSLAAVLRYRVRRLNIHATTRSLTDEILAVTSGDAFRFYYGTDPSVRFVCSHNLLVAACDAWGLGHTWQHSGSFDASWQIVRSAIDDGSPALVAYRPDPKANEGWIPLSDYATWGLVVGYDDRAKTAVLAPAGRASTSYGTEIVDDFPDRWEGWAPGPEGWVKYPVFVPGERETKPRTRGSLFERAVGMLSEGEAAIAGRSYVAGVAGLEKWANDLRDGREFDQTDGPRFDMLAAANLEMASLLRPTRRTAAMYLFGQSAKHQNETGALLREAAGLYLDVSEPLAFDLEEALTETPEIRSDPDHAVSHLEVTKELLRDPKARAKGADVVDQIADKEREALDRLLQIAERSR